MKFKSNIIASGSGSFGGTTVSRNRYGMYMRSRTIPVNPATLPQTTVRNAFTQLVTRWIEVLTGAQRAAWSTYAANVPLIDALGDPRVVTGQNMYIRSNVSRLQTGLAVVDAAPTVFDLGSYTAPAYTVTAAADTVSVAFTIADAWRSETGAALLMYQGLPMNGTRTFYGGPWRFTGGILGNLGAPPASPQVKVLAFPVSVGHIVPFFSRVTRADGRLSSMIRTMVIAGA